MFAKLIDLVAKFRSGDIKGAVKLILETLLENIDLLPLPGTGDVRTLAMRPSADLVDEIDALAKTSPEFTAQAGLFEKLRPLLLELLLRLVGG